MPWAKRQTVAIPSIGSNRSSLELNDYSKGFNSFISNDKFPVKDGGVNLWRLAQNARITTLGEYDTRKGFDYFSDAAGETEDDTETSTTGADDADFNSMNRLAMPFTAGATARLSKVRLNLKNDNSATGTVMVEIWSDDEGEPGSRLARSSIAASTITSSYQYLTARFASAPSVTSSSTYWIVAYVQANGSNSYSWSTTTNGSTALSSDDFGASWSATEYNLNFYQYYATSGGVKGFFRAFKSDGTKVCLLAQGTSLYSVNNTTGALTAIKTGLSSSATHYRFEIVNDIVYYVNGFDGYRKWDFTTESQVNSTNYTHIREHKGLMFLVTKDDPNKMVYSNFADYETFTSTDFIYVPSPKTGDPVTAVHSLNGFLLIKTLDNCFILSGSDNATFLLDEAPDQKGTFTQETSTADKNFVYFLANDGVYRTNGSEPQLLSSDVYDEIRRLPNKDDACMVINKGRLYLWYTPASEAENSKCYVFSLNFGDDGGTTESLDTGAYVARAFSGFRDDDDLFVASSRLGQVYKQELETNDHTNLGDDIEFMLQTHYFVGKSPAVLKQFRYWEPRFAAQDSSYTITAEYAYDLRDNWQSQATPNVQGAGVKYGGGAKYGDGSTYGSTAELQAQLYVPGEYRRVAVRYKHFATRQPNTFLGHTFIIETRRIR